MSLMESEREAVEPRSNGTAEPKAGAAEFEFLPRSLTAGCRRLIEAYHDIHGFGCLPDILWQGDVRDFVETHVEFWKIFKRACRFREAKRSNASLVLIATAILSLEVLASGFADWGRRYPTAKRRANDLLARYTHNSRTSLMDRYLYPRSHVSPALLSGISPPAGSASEPNTHFPERAA